MKAKELMIGDWVLAEGKLTQVTDIDELDGINRVWIAGCEDGGCIREKDIEPIPLTEEILVKNGWELCKTADTRSYWHDDIPFHIPIEPYHHWRGDEDKIFADDFFDCVYIRIQYIHEFQHALKLCGIEKEIIL